MHCDRSLRSEKLFQFRSSADILMILAFCKTDARVSSAHCTGSWPSAESAFRVTLNGFLTCILALELSISLTCQRQHTQKPWVRHSECSGRQNRG